MTQRYKFRNRWWALLQIIHVQEVLRVLNLRFVLSCRQQKREDCHSTRIRLMGAQNGVLWKQLWHSDWKIRCCTCGTLITGWQTLGTEYSDRHMLGPAKTVAFSFCGLPNMDSSRRYNLRPGLVLKSFLQQYSSHRILRYVYGALNVDEKKTNYTVWLEIARRTFWV
jgi:hypothetical protein